MSQFKKTLLLFFLLGKALVMPAQTASIDSLRFIIKFNTDNAKKIKAYKVLAKELLFKDFDACQETATTGAVLAEKLKDSASLSELKKTTGLSWYFKGVYDSAAVYYYKSLEIANKVADASVKAGVLNELGKPVPQNQGP